MDSCVGKHEQKEQDNCKKRKCEVMWPAYTETSQTTIQPAANLMSVYWTCQVDTFFDTFSFYYSLFLLMCMSLFWYSSNAFFSIFKGNSRKWADIIIILVNELKILKTLTLLLTAIEWKVHLCLLCYRFPASCFLKCTQHCLWSI